MSQRTESPTDARADAGVPERAVDAVAPRWFAGLFALAVVAHIVGNPPAAPDALGVTSLALAVAVAAVVARPSSRRWWAAAAGLQLATVWLEAPVLGNHWLLMGCFSLAVLLALTRAQPWPWLASVVGWSFIAFYAFAAFAKLNTSFLEPSVSCAVFYADQGLASWGLPTLPRGSGVAVLPIATALVVELSVPVLLVVRRARSIGVTLAAVFHYVISLDLAQHFFDFTAVIFVGLAVLAAPEATRPIGDWIDRRPRAVRLLAAVWAVLILAAVLPPSPPLQVLGSLVFFASWAPLGAAIVWWAVRATRRPAATHLGRFDVAAAVLVALVVLNGVTPYIGLKTAFGWNMYANLVTSGGRSNHLLVPGVAPAVDAEYVVVTAASEEALRAYVGSGWAVPERNLRDHLAAHPRATVTFERADGTVVSGTGRQLGRALPLVVRRLAPLRSVDLSDPARCQALWLPAL
ncbi:MAG: hypothetical protein KY460_00470 [Actinobacteria bacterium]|nr:hypothetical protein [Actinomycetota bacterium]